MYNREQKNSQAWWAMEEFINVAKDVTQANESMEDAAESAVGTISELEDECQELETERDDLQREVDELKEKQGIIDPVDVLDLLDRLRTAAVAVVTFVGSAEIELRKAYGLAEDGTGGSDGDRGDDSPEGTGDARPGETTSGGVTRPQIP